VGPAILHELEKFSVHFWTIVSSFYPSVKAPEDALVHIFVEAKITPHSFYTYLSSIFGGIQLLDSRHVVLVIQSLLLCHDSNNV
jgi:hypothetical protein